MRRIALAGLALILFACSTSTGSSPAASSTTSPASSLAADFVTRMELLVSEHSFLIAKSTEAAVLQIPDYVGYLQLLASNQEEIAAAVREAVGNTSAADFTAAWQQVDDDIARYGVGAVSRDQSKSAAASSDLNENAVPALIQVIVRLTGVSETTIAQWVVQWARSGPRMVDDAMARKYDFFYADLAAMFGSAHAWAELAARAIVAKFPDKYPGNLAQQAVSLRLTLNAILLEHSYLSTMATAAIVADRAGERERALMAVSSNSEALLNAFDAVDRSSLASIWIARINAIVDYSTGGDAASKLALTGDFVTRFAALTHVPSTAVGDQVAATIKVIDDQRNKSYDALPADDRAAATAMQPVADAIAGA